MQTFKIYVCSPYLVFKDDKKKAREVAIKALAEANEYFNGDEKYELFSPVLSNSAYRNLSYPEVMAICLKQLDSCGALFVPSTKTCDKELILGSQGIGIEIRHAFMKNYPIYDPGDILTIIEVKKQMTTQEKIDIIKFYDEGREIEIRCKNSDNAWSKYDNNLCGDFDFRAFEYRVNPRKFKVGDVVISKKQEGKMLYQHTMETIDEIRTEFYIVNGGSRLSFESEDRYIKINELLWYFESLGQDGY